MNKIEPKNFSKPAQRTSVAARYLSRKTKEKPLHLSRSNSVTDVERETLINRVDQSDEKKPNNDLIGALYDQTKVQQNVNNSIKTDFDMVFSNSLKMSD